LFWILSGYEAPDQLYLDYDHFTVYEGDITYQLLKPYSDRMRTEAAACMLAEGADHGAPSLFVSARKAPQRNTKSPSAGEPIQAPNVPDPESADGAAEIYKIPHAFSRRLPS
jgi:hypothetical protein